MRPVPTESVKETVSLVDGELAVGEDLEFQYRWWRFERGIWILFTLLVILDMVGAFGRGPLAKAEFRTSEGSFDIRYERVERFSTPSLLSIQFGPSAIRDGKIKIWVSDSLLKRLGNQRVIPQPESTVLDRDGILYTFDATSVPALVQFALEPSSVGLTDLQFRVPDGGQTALLKIFVMP